MGVVNIQRIYSVTSWQDCATRCRAKASCTEWTWWDSTNIKTNFRNVCRLSEGFTFTEYYSSATSGTRSCQGWWWCKNVFCMFDYFLQTMLAGWAASKPIRCQLTMAVLRNGSVPSCSVSLSCNSSAQFDTIPLHLAHPMQCVESCRADSGSWTVAVLDTVSKKCFCVKDAIPADKMTASLQPQECELAQYHVGIIERALWSESTPPPSGL